MVDHFKTTLYRLNNFIVYFNTKGKKLGLLLESWESPLKCCCWEVAGRGGVMYGSSWLAGMPPAMAVAAGMSMVEDREL